MLQNIGSQTPMNAFSRPLEATPKSSPSSTGASSLSAKSSGSQRDQRSSFENTLDQAAAQKQRSSLDKRAQMSPEERRPASRQEASGGEAPRRKWGEVDRDPVNGLRSHLASGDPSQSSQRLSKTTEAMLKFMDSMESELGVSPEEMIEAMKASGQWQDQWKDSMETVALEAGSSEFNLAKVLAQLDLKGDDVDQAAKLYQNLLQETSSSGQDFDLGQMRTEVTRWQNPRFLAEQERTARHRSSIDQISLGFASRDNEAASLEGASFKDPKILRQEQSMNQVIDRFHQVPRIKNPAEALPEGATQFTNQEVTQALERLQKENTVQRDSALSANWRQMLNESVAARSQAAGAETGYSEMPRLASNANFGGFSTEGMTPSSGLSLTTSGEGSSSNSDASFFAQSESAFGDSQADQWNEDMDLDGSTRFQVPTPVATKSSPGAQSLSNVTMAAGVGAEGGEVNEIVEQAQMMVRKGGGEMKMQLNSEGMGPLNLKVDVQNGQVNVQMLTDSPEVKRLIESQLSDLKDGLTMQKLNVDQVKVDVSSDLSRDFSGEQDEAQKDQAREFARDFLGSHRDGNANRQDFLASPFQKYFQQSRNQVQPVEVDGDGATTQSQKKHVGSLDLVA